MTEGQAQAIAELTGIATEDPAALSVDRHGLFGDQQKLLEIELTLRIGKLETADGGLKLRERERFIARIPEDFPFRKPEIWVRHKRFAGFPHVQWSHYICLYQANTEWNASDGMFGLVERLWQWIENAAKNSLDPQDGPLHPPAIYPQKDSKAELVIDANAPGEVGSYWPGWAHADKQGATYSITGWHHLTDREASESYGERLKFPVAIMPEALPWEFPTKGEELLDEVQKQGVDRDWFLALMTIAANEQKDGNPVVVIIGVPMRRGHEGEPRIHFSAWQISDETADGLRKSIPQGWDNAELSEIREKMAECTLKLFELGKVSWCRVYENREEIVLRRDRRSPSRVWRGKRIALFGCGALGSFAAEMIARGGCDSLILVDYDTVTPGVLVRQNYRSGDVGEPKVAALKERLLEVVPDLEVVSLPADAFAVASDPDILGSIDCVVDTTASNLLHQRLEREWMALKCREAAYVAVEIDSTASCCWSVLLPKDSQVGPWSAFREARLALGRSQSTKKFIRRFERDSGRRPFQPEPGCSEPTFEGSAADLMALAASAVNHAAEWVLSGSAAGQMFSFDRSTGRLLVQDFTGQIRRSLGGLNVLISESALAEVFANIKKHSRESDPLAETGGLLWGQWDSAANVVWISDASDAPPDSSKSPERFTCGVEGTGEEHASRMELSMGACGFVGMWHTHPSSPPDQSTVDVDGMFQMLVLQSEWRRNLILLIVGKEGDDTTLGLYSYKRSRQEEYERVEFAPEFIELGRMEWK